MLIEIHMIQNHSPSNLNRDDLGAPKMCLFGGVTRARISSQCLKRSIRRSADFQKAMEKDGGVRTRRLITVLAERVHGSSPAPKELIELVAEAFKKGGVERTKKGEEPDNTSILMFLPQSTIEKMVKAVSDASNRKAKPDDLCNALAQLLGEKVRVADIALCGRMTELDSEGLFRKIEFHVEAAMQVAHAISTHAVVNEVDYFTAVDDLGRTQASGHLGEAMFNSACFYKYFCLDWEQLVHNLAGPEPDQKNDAEAHKKWMKETKPEGEKLAARTLGHFLRAAALTTPSGKQNSSAANNEACGILVEVKKDGKISTSYANAFAEPVERIGKPDDDAPDEKSIEGRSVACLADHVQSLRKAYGIESTLLWYSPKLWRFPLRYWERAEDGKKKEAKRVTKKTYDVLGGEDGKPGGLVEAVIGEIGFKWHEVRNIGKEPQA